MLAALVWGGAYAVGHVLHKGEQAQKQCPWYGPWPGQNDCGGWVSYLSNGYPTWTERGAQANAMSNSSEWQGICSNSQMYELQNNNFAYGIYAYDVNSAVDGINGVITDKQQLHDIAVIMTTKPSQPCQAADWASTYMGDITPDTQKILKKWLAYT